MDDCVSDEIGDDSHVTLGLYSNSPEEQLIALQCLHKERQSDVCEDKSAHELKHAQMIYMYYHLPRIKHILKTSASLTLQVEALCCLIPRNPEEKLHWFDLMGPITCILLTAEEDMLTLTFPLLRYMTDSKPKEAECLHRCGVIDALCIRITSAAKASTATQLLVILFSLLHNIKETQAFDGVFICARTILSREEGVLSTSDVQLSCVQALKTYLQPHVNLEGFIKSNITELLMERLRTEPQQDMKIGIVSMFITLSSTHCGSRCLLQAGLINVLLMFLMSNNDQDDTFKLLFWLVGKITGDYIELRDLSIQSGVVQSVVKVALADDLSIGKRQRLMRLLAIFFRPDPTGVPSDLARDILQVLKICLKIQNAQVKLDALFGLQCLTVMYCGSTFQGVEYVTEMDLIPPVMDIVRSEDTLQSRSALGVVCNITKSQKQGAIRVLLDNGLLQHVAVTLHSLDDVYEKLVILHSIAKCGHGEEIFRHISVQMLLDVVNRVPSQVGQCALKVFHMVIQQGNPVVLKSLVASPLLHFLRDNGNTIDRDQSWRSVQSLKSLAVEIEDSLEQMAQKHGIFIDWQELVRDTAVPMDV